MYRAKKIKVVFENDDGFWNLQIFWSGYSVAHIHCIVTGNCMMISDILVGEDVRICTLVSSCFLLPTKMREKSTNFRGQGLGSLLLDRLLQEADKAGIHTIWGSVTRDDIQRTPGLLDWYRRRGFIVENPDDECIGAAVAKIVRTRPKTHN